MPHLTLDNFSPGIREQIAEVYSYARSHPGDAAASGRLGMVLHTYGLLQEAADCYRPAGQLEPNVFQWAYYLGVVEADQGRCDAATSTLRLALQINAGYLPTKLRLANCLHASAAWEASGKLYAEIVEQRPDNADAYYGLGRVRAARHDLKGAAEAFSKACALFPNFGPAHYALALVRRSLGQVSQAEEHLHLYDRNKDGAPPSSDPLLEEVRFLRATRHVVGGRGGVPKSHRKQTQQSANTLQSWARLGEPGEVRGRNSGTEKNDRTGG